MVISFLIILAIILWSINMMPKSGKKQINFIKDYEFPDTINKKIKKAYPKLSKKEIALVLETLKIFFIISNRAGLKPVAMPSQVVDVAWHEFILFTKEYQKFCKKAFGRFLHHTPTEAMASKTTAQDGIKLVWAMACRHEGLSSNSPFRLPMLFAIDRDLKIKDGFIYSINCEVKSSANRKNSFCASAIGCASGNVGCASGNTGGESKYGGSYGESFTSSSDSSSSDISSHSSGDSSSHSCSSCGSGCGGGD